MIDSARQRHRASYFVFFCSKQEEKEQMNEFKTLLNGLNKRSRSIIQLKPRNPTTPIKGKTPIQAVCDFKQQEVRFFNPDTSLGFRRGRTLICLI